MAVDAAGNLYIADTSNTRIRKVDTDGNITTFAGNGSYGAGGDGGAASAAQLSAPRGVAVDGSGNIYIADTGNHRIRKVDSEGAITTVAGSGARGFSGDGGTATAAWLTDPNGVAVDGSGNIYIADTGNHRIRKVDSEGAITTVAGSGAWGFSGDGGAAAAAQLRGPRGVAVDAAGNLYIADTNNHRIRRVVSITLALTDYFRIVTAAGSETSGFGGDGGAAAAAQLREPNGVAVDGSGNIYIADTNNHRIRKVDSGGAITTVAGSGTSGFGGDGGAAAAAQLREPGGAAVDSAGNLYIADAGNHRIRKVDSGGAITTVAGSGTSGFGGDGGAAAAAQLREPGGAAVDSAGNLYIADAGNHRIRKVDSGGAITTVAGSGTSGFGGDGGAATAAGLDNPIGVAVDSAGNLYIADAGNHRIRKVDTLGAITTVAGSGTAGYSGDGGAATAAQLSSPYGVAVDSAGNLYIADESNHRIRKVDSGGAITTVAGSGTAGYGGDGGAATAAQLREPIGVAVDSAGNLYIADTGNHRIRWVLPPVRVTLTAAPGTITSGRSATLTWSSPDAVSAEIDNDVGTVSPATGGTVEVTPTETTAYTVTVTFADNSTAVASATVTVSDPPTATLSAAPETITAGQSAVLSVASTNAVSAEIDQGVGAVTLDNTGAGSVTVSPAATTEYTLTVTDANGFSVQATATVTVNDAPTADAGPDQTVAEGVAVTLDGSGSSDPEGEALTYAWTQTSGQDVTLNGAATASPSFTAPTQLAADAVLVFSLTVTDARNEASTADTVTVTVTAGTNDAPTANAGPDQTVAEGAAVTLDGSGSSDPEGEALTYAWTQTSGQDVTLNGAATASPSFTAPTDLAADAVLVFSLTVTDARNAASTADTVTITVTAGSNDAPTANAGPDQTVAEGAAVTLDGSGSSDPEGEALTYAWTQTSGQDVTLNGAATASPSFTAPTQLAAEAVLVFSLTVSDGVNTSPPDTVTVTVEAGTNDAPTANAGPDQTVAEGAAVTLDGSGSSDPEGEALTYAWSQTSGQTVNLSGDNTASPSFTAPTDLAADAVLVFSLTVTDARNEASTADTVTITVTAGTNDAPTANAGPDQTVAEGAAVTLDGSGSSDPEGEALTYAWTQTSGQDVTLNGAATASPSFTAPTQLTADAVLVFSLTVTDARNEASTADTVTITVTAGSNDAPTANAGPDQTVAEGAAVTLDGSGSSDPEGETLTYAWSQTSGQDVTLSGDNTASPSFTAPTQLLQTAVLVFSLTVSDGVNASPPDTVTVTVEAPSTLTFRADDDSITAGQSATLRWTATNAKSAEIDQGVGTVSPAAGGSVEVTPSADTTYTLTVTDNNNAVSTASLTITVAAAPAIAAFTAHPATIELGDSSTLAWTATGDAITAVIDRDVGAVSPATGGSTTVTPTTDGVIAYTLTVTDANSVQATATATLTVTFNTSQTSVDTVVGGDPGYDGDGGPASEAQVDSPGGAILDAEGNLYFADTGNHRVRKIDAAGMITTVAGNGTAGYDGDGGSADAAQLNFPRGVAVDAEGNLYIADTWNHRVRAVDAATQTIDTIAGDGTPGALNFPYDVAVDAAGNLYIADWGNHRVLASDGAFFAPKRSAKNAPQGRAQETLSTPLLLTVAGTGAAGFDGDGGAAAEALLDSPAGVAVDAEGVLYIADTSNHRIRRVDAEGNIETVAGSGAAGYNGDGGAATATQLNAPAGIVVDQTGALYIMDTENHRIRKVAPEPPAEQPRDPEPAVRARTFELLFVLPQDAAPATQEVVLYAEDGDADFLLQPAQGWIAVEPASGSLAEGEETTVEVTVDPAGLRAASAGRQEGLHKGRVYVRSEGRLTGWVRVALEVLPPEGPAVLEQGVVNAAVMSAAGRPGLFGAAALPVAPGSMVVVQGENFTSGSGSGETVAAEGFPLPARLGGTAVRLAIVGGAGGGLEARLFAVGPQRIEAQLPLLLGREALEEGGTDLLR